MSYRGPHRRRLGLQLNALGVGYSIAKLRGLAPINHRGARVKAKNLKLPAAQLLDGHAVLLVLLLFLHFGCVVFDVAPILPPRNHHERDAQRSDEENYRGIQQGIFKNGLRSRNRARHHKHAPRGPGLLEQSNANGWARAKERMAVWLDAGRKTPSEVIHFAAWASSRQVTSLMFCSSTNLRNCALVKKLKSRCRQADPQVSRSRVAPRISSSSKAKCIMKTVTPDSRLFKAFS